MERAESDRLARRLDEASGYLMLDMPVRALEILTAREEWPTLKFEASMLTGEALRALERYRDALVPLEQAAALRPKDLAVAVALGWCYKRTHRLAQAIDALERVLPEHSGEPLLHYNLACYWSLAGDPAKAVKALAEAIELNPSVKEQVASETDFDPIRHDAAFERLLAGKTTQA